MENEISCGECDAKFTMKKNFYAHLRKIHDRELVLPGRGNGANLATVANVMCHICGQRFIKRSNLSRHLKQIHKVPASKIECLRKSRIKCPLEDCSECFRNYDYLRMHITSKHKVEIECDEFKFESTFDFHQWKNQIQEQTLSMYVLHTSSTLLSDGSKKEYYNCHRSYNYISKGNNKRRLKSQGTNKIGKACPSRIEVLTKNSDGPVLVKYWKTHVSHSLDIDRIVLSKETRAEIEAKLNEGVTQSLVDPINPSSSQKQHITMDDITRKLALLISRSATTSLSDADRQSVINILDKITIIFQKNNSQPV